MAGRLPHVGLAPSRLLLTTSLHRSISAPTISTLRSFSTSSPSSASAAPTRRVPIRPNASSNRKRNNDRPTVNPPSVGDRRRFKKQVTLSNPNALPVQAELLDANTLLNDRNIGRMVRLAGPTVETLTSVKAFKPSQAWSFFHKPTVLVRPESVELAGQMQRAAANRSTVRKVLVGHAGCGKSVLLLQALAHAYLNNWIVLYIPEGRDLILNRSEYSVIKDTDPAVYQQPSLTSNLLRQLLQHRQMLDSLQLHPSVQPPAGVRPGLTLAQLCDLGIRSADLAWPVFRSVWQELMRPNDGTEKVPRPPIFMGVDGLSYLMDTTDYLSTSLDRIHAHDMALIRHFVACLSGHEDEFAGVSGAGLANGGAVVAAMSMSGTSVSDSLAFALNRAEKAQLASSSGVGMSETEIPVWNGYRMPDKAVIDAIDPATVEVSRLGPLDMACTTTLIKYFRSSGLLGQSSLSSPSPSPSAASSSSTPASQPADNPDGPFVRQCLTSSGGVVSELERLLLREVRV